MLLHEIISETTSPKCSSINAWSMTPQDFWECALVSGTGKVAVDPLGVVSKAVGPSWIRLICPAHPIICLATSFGLRSGRINILELYAW